jgi:hypothetical protein
MWVMVGRGTISLLYKVLIKKAVLLPGLYNRSC